MKVFSLEEFKPSIFFLLKFVGLYVLINLLYGWYVHSYYPGVDPITVSVTQQTSSILTSFGWPTDVAVFTERATAIIVYNGRDILAVFEGCNGVNVIIIYASFLLAFGPYKKQLTWFLPLGILVIHFFNLIRVFLLFFVSIEMPKYMYFTHKYFFTAILYVVIFALWIIWLRMHKPVRNENR